MFKPNSYIFSASAKCVQFVYFFLLIKISTVYLSTEEFGFFFLVYNAGLYFSAVSLGQPAASILRFYHDVIQKKRLYRVIFKQSIFSTVFCFLLTMVVISVVSFLGFDLYEIGKFSVLFGIAHGILHLILSTVRTQGKFHIFFGVILVHSFSTLITLFLFRSNLSWKRQITLMIIASVCVCLLTSIYTKINVKKIYLAEYDYDLNKRTFAYGLPIVLVALFNQLLSSSDQFFLKFHGYSKELGIYTANYGIAEKGIFAFLSVIVTAFVPQLYEAYDGNNFKAFKMITIMTSAFLFFVGLEWIFVYNFSYELSLFFSNSEYVEGHRLIPLVSLGCIFLGVASLYSEMLTLQKKTKTLALCYFSGAVLNMILNFIFVKDNGIFAAVYTSISSYFLLMVIMLGIALIEIRKEKSSSKKLASP